MHLLHLPDLITEQIISYLPLHEQLRVGRICQDFRRVSNSVVSKSKILHLQFQFGSRHCEKSKYFDRMSPYQLECLLRQCASKLHRIQIEDRGTATMDEYGRALGEVLCKFAYPKLVYLDLGYVEMETTTFGLLLQQSTNVRTLIRRPVQSFSFPLEIAGVAEHLESIVFDVANETLSSIIGRVPNLKRLSFVRFRADPNQLGAFFAGVPNLESIDIEFATRGIADPSFDGLESFWRLKELRQLRIDRYCSPLGQESLAVDLRRLTASFPNLVRLELTSIQWDKNAIVELARSMPRLESIRLVIKNGRKHDSDLTIREFARLDGLKEIDFGESRINVSTFVTLVRSCPKLINLTFDRIDGLCSDKVVDQTLRPFSGSGPPRKVEISLGQLSSDSMYVRSELRGKEAREFKKELEANEGIKLTIDIPPGCSEEFESDSSSDEDDDDDEDYTDDDESEDGSENFDDEEEVTDGDEEDGE